MGPSPRWRGARGRADPCDPRRGTIPALAGSTRSHMAVADRTRDHPRAGGEHAWFLNPLNADVGPSPRWRGARRDARYGEAGCGTIPALAGSTPPAGRRPTATRDHPRAGGEHDLRFDQVDQHGGPSPRWRGALALVVVDPVAGGTIPALAGSTPPIKSGLSPPWDHPRAGGEHLINPTGLPIRLGPSPRWRGARPPGPARRLRGGTIPALAGSTPATTAARPSARDHPRAGEEHTTSVPAAVPDPGPSPRWRGARAQPGRRGTAGRTIPALAGSTRRRPTGSPRRGDHPRAGGEHGGFQRAASLRGGPSPRWRGAHQPDRRSAERIGTIPALAGSTPSPPVPSFTERDHPRAGGEHPTGSSSSRTCLGPSPRWRGARGVGPSSCPEPGTIPALAGSTRCGTRWPTPSGDHPRAGGEHKSIGRWHTAQPGPSPRWRGAHGAARGGDRQRGTIPALAGSTAT